MLSGPSEIRCVVDSASELSESNEDDNLDASTLFATGRPDLSVVSLSAPSPFHSTSEAVFVVENIGETAYREVDYGFTQNLAGGGASLGGGAIAFLDVGESSEQRVSSWQCVFSSGDGQLIVRVGDEAIPEIDDANNERSRSVRFQMSGDFCP